MPMEPEDMRFAMNDVRERHKAVVTLLADNDKQALSFLQVYVALAGAAISGGAAIVLPKSTEIPLQLGYGLLGFGVTLVIGAILCLAAVWPSDVNLPGRKADFWLWAMESDPNLVFQRYLENLQQKEIQNSKLNARCAKLMMAAKCLGVLSPIIAFCFALASIRL